MYIRSGTTYGAVMLELLRFEEKLTHWKRLFFLSAMGLVVFVYISISFQSVLFMLLSALCLIGTIVGIANSVYNSHEVQYVREYMLSKLDLDRYNSLREEISENYVGKSKTPKTVIKTVRECNPDFLQAVKDFFILPLRDQEHIVSCLRGDEKPQTEIYKKMIQTFKDSGYSVKDIIGVLQTIKTKVF